jgi:hypothetical protein
MADNPALIDACLEAGININSTCGYGNTDTSLWYSIVNSRLKSITHLILKGANVTDAEISQARRMGGETLQTFNAAVSDLAKAKESEEELEKLHDLYCKINNQQLTSPASLKTEVSLFKDLGRTKWANYGKDGKHYLTSLLTASVYADNPALIDACLEAGININSTGVSGYSTSLWSSIYCSKLKSIRHLILKGAKVTYAEISQAREIGGETLQTFNAAVSDLAKAKGLNDLFDKELKKVYDLICKINNQQLTSPASLKTELSLFKDLGRTKWANYGKDGNNYLISPLTASVLAENPALIDACLEAGININSTCGNGFTSLLYSIKYSSLKSITHLILKGAKVTDAEISKASKEGGETLQTFNAAVSDLAKAKDLYTTPTTMTDALMNLRIISDNCKQVF